MIGSGIASSLVHEVGHQGAALLNLVSSLRQVLQGMYHSTNNNVWHSYDRWISEIVADFWSVARVGVASTLGLIGVVSLPRAFVFRLNIDDPHPLPWIRVKLSCAIGESLYPHPQWNRIAQLWESFYPLDGLNEEKQRLIGTLESTIPDFVEILLNYRPKLLRGESLKEVMAVEERQPNRLVAYYHEWSKSPALMRTAPPSLVFAVIGQAKADGTISPEKESSVLANLLTYWALRSTLDTSALCAALPTVKVVAPIT
jgi:hypothetical protein